MAVEDAIHITRAAAGDVNDVAIFIRDAWREAGPDAPGFSGATEEIIAELVRPEAIMERITDHRLLLARRRGRVVGFAAGRHLDAATVELAGIIVLQSMLGRGIGSALLERMVAAARAAGYGRMIVHTETDNDRAVSFYTAQGFSKVRRTVEEVADTRIDVWELQREI